MPNLFLFLYAAVQYMLRPGPGQQGIRTVQYSDVADIKKSDTDIVG